MSKHKIIGLALCGLILTSCGNGGENTAEETVSPETSAASESVSETTVSETETKRETETKKETETEIPEISETVTEETESTENFDKVKDRVIFEDGENTLTAGQFIEALFECEKFTHMRAAARDFQIMDMDENGIPEIMLYYSNFMSYTGSQLYTVTDEGKAEVVLILNHDICDSSNHSECYNLIGENPIPYKKDGKTVWISRFFGSGTGGGGGGNYILKYDSSGIDGEIICEARYYRWSGNDENGELEWYSNEYYYIFGKEVTEDEFDLRDKEYFDSLQTSDALYVQSPIGDYDENKKFLGSEFGENLSYALNNYLDMRDGA